MMTNSQFRVGEGWDVHALVPGRTLIIGGVQIPFHLGLLGHSDADVLLHAITDALLGAAGLGDIGTHFPDTDDRWKNCDSSQLLKETGILLANSGWQIVNIDSTVVAQAPKLMDYKLLMRQRISSVLNLGIDSINIKAKTAEKLGPVGMGQSIEARAVVLIQSN
jgi:2-C-methyl-D-erythritol 2,4-cyclodiphosphate synthase